MERMAKAYLLQRRGDALRLTLEDNRLITGEGPSAIVQSFPSAEEAEAHLELVLSRRRREGYSLATHDPARAPAAADPLADCVAWDPARRRMRAVFRGMEVEASRCEAIVERAEALQPLTLELVCDPASPESAFSTAIAGARLGSVRSLIFDAPARPLARQRDNSLGDLALVFKAMPALERAFITGDSALRPADHPALRELYLRGDPLGAATLRGLGESHFPRLEVLALALSGESAPGPESASATAVISVDAPELRRVEVTGAGDLVRFLAALTEWTIPASWSVLRLQGDIDDEDALLELLAERAYRLERLPVCALPLADELSQGAAARAAAIVAGVRDCEDVPELLSPATHAAW